MTDIPIEEKIDLKKLYWASGFLEGEGCFTTTGPQRTTPIVTATQVQREPLERLLAIFGGKIYLYHYGKRRYYKWDATGIRAIGIMFCLFQLMSPNRKKRIKDAVILWKSIKPLGKYRTHCPNGHPYNEENTYLHRNKYRQCVICRRDHSRNSEEFKRFKKYSI